MALQLSGEEEYVTVTGGKVPFYKEFVGRPVDTVPNALARGLAICSPFDILERRIFAPEKVLSAWRNNYFNTSAGFALHPDGDKFKISSDITKLFFYFADNQMNLHELPDGLYELLPWQEFTRRKVTLVKNLSYESARENPVWHAAVGDAQAFKDFLTPDNHRILINGSSQGMSVNLPFSSERDFAVLGALTLGWLTTRSRLFGWGGLSVDLSRLVGKVPEALMHFARQKQQVTTETLSITI